MPGTYPIVWRGTPSPIYTDLVPSAYARKCMRIHASPDNPYTFVEESGTVAYTETFFMHLWCGDYPGCPHHAWMVKAHGLDESKVRAITYEEWIESIHRQEMSKPRRKSR